MLSRPTSACTLVIHVYFSAPKTKAERHRDKSTFEKADPIIATPAIAECLLCTTIRDKTLYCVNLQASMRIFFPFPIHNFFLFTQKSSLCKFQLCVRMDEKQPSHLNSLLIIVWETQIERSNLHLDCFSRRKLINTATQPTLLY